MSYRLDEGQGVCHYRIGVEDDGCHSLLNYENIAESARIIECIARSLNAIVSERKIIQNEVVLDEDDNAVKVGPESAPVIVFEPSLLGGALGHIAVIDSDEIVDNKLIVKDDVKGVYTRAELSIQRVETHLLDPSPISLAELASSASALSIDDNSQVKGVVNNSSPSSKLPPSCNEKTETVNVGETLSSRNIRIAVVGNVDAGKSTLIGTLTTSCLDDGRGKSRTAIMKHRHEIESGRTSTATTHLMGFRSSGEPVTGRDRVRAMKRKGEDEIARESYRVITLMDLAGHEKYLKTTIHGVSSGFADHALILVNARYEYFTHSHVEILFVFVHS
jgi:GTPase